MILLLHAHIILLLYIILYEIYFVHILPNVNVFSHHWFLLMMLGLNMYNIIEI